MVPQSVVVCLALLAFTAATEVHQCPGKSVDNLSNNVQLSPCTRPPCRLKKGTNQHISINFTPDRELPDVFNKVSAKVGGLLDLPFVGVDGNSICGKVFTAEDEPAPCPLQAGTNYIYKDSFPVLSVYPKIAVDVKWSLTSGNHNIICFTVPAKIV